MIRALLLLAVPAATLLAAEPDPEPVSSSPAHLKKMQGNWVVVRIELNGRDDKEKRGVVFMIEKDRMVIKDPKRDETATFKLDARKKPRHIDLSPIGPKGPKGRDMVLKGIYKFAGNELTFVFSDPGKERPAKFEDKSRLKLVLRRQKAKK
jgi:uncharacterized protein (TIGR03067 family)